LINNQFILFYNYSDNKDSSRLNNLESGNLCIMCIHSQHWMMNNMIFISNTLGLED